MSGLRALLIRGSEKVIGHYRHLLRMAMSEQERADLNRRIEQEQRKLDELLRRDAA
jgi:hypothetical protein